jgi:hypothetical protein
MRAHQHNSGFNSRCNFPDALNAPGLSVPASLLDSIGRKHTMRNTMQHASAAATVDEQYCADTILDAVGLIDHLWPGASTNDLNGWMICALRIVRLYSNSGDQKLRPLFEDSIRDGAWRAASRPARKNELIIEPGHRQYWTLLMIQSQVQVEAILNTLGIP